MYYTCTFIIYFIDFSFYILIRVLLFHNRRNEDLFWLSLQVNPLTKGVSCYSIDFKT